MAAGILLPITALSNQSASAAPAPPTAHITADSLGSVISFIRKHPAEYSGIYLDRATGQYVIGVPTGTDESAALMNITRNLETPGSSKPSLALMTTPQKRSLADLMDIHARISSQYGEFGALAGQDLTQWGLDEQRNAVQVGVLRLDSALTDSAQRTYGDGVYLRKVERHHVAVRHDPLAEVLPPPDFGPLDRQLDRQPYWAANHIGWINGGRITRCTSGWASGVRRGQLIGPEDMWTAGHCFP